MLRSSGAKVSWWLEAYWWEQQAVPKGWRSMQITIIGLEDFWTTTTDHHVCFHCFPVSPPVRGRGGVSSQASSPLIDPPGSSTRQKVIAF